MKATGHIKTTFSTRTMTVLAAVALVLCSACSKIERVHDDAQQELAFRPIDRQMTKATSGLPVGTFFGLFAYHTELPGESPWNTAWQGTINPYIQNAPFGNHGDYYAGWDPSSGTGTHHPYYWPFSGSLMFAGYSPYAAVDAQGTATGGGPVTKVVFHENVIEGASNPYLEIGYDMPDDNTIASMGTTELLYFDVSSVNIDPEDQQSKTTGKQETPVDIVFKHALSMVQFNVTHEYTSVSVTLTECIDKGTFYSGLTAGWLPDRTVNGAGQLTSVKDYVFARDETDKTFITAKYVIPQYTTGWFEEIGEYVGDKIMLVVTIKDSVDRTPTSETIQIPLEDYLDRIEMGKKHILNLNIQKKPVEFGAPIEITLNEVDI